LLACRHDYIFLLEGRDRVRAGRTITYTQLVVRFVASGPNSDTVRRRAEELAQRVAVNVRPVELRDAAVIGPAFSLYGACAWATASAVRAPRHSPAARCTRSAARLDRRYRSGEYVVADGAHRTAEDNYRCVADAARKVRDDVTTSPKGTSPRLVHEQLYSRYAAFEVLRGSRAQHVSL